MPMAQNPELNSGSPRRRRGRPSRSDELKRTLAELGCDPAAIDPLRVLASIAADVSMPATARVNAAKALLVQRAQPAEASNAVADRAIKLMAERREH